LRDRSTKDAVVIAHRAAMRVAPLYWDATRGDNLKDKLTELGVLRACLISGVSGTRPTPEIWIAADAVVGDVGFTEANAAASVYAAAAAGGTGDHTVFTDNSAVAAAVVSPAEMWRAVRNDCTAIVSGAEPIALPLWHAAASPLDKHWQRVRQVWLDRGAGWRFWVTWYDDALAGNEPNQHLLTEIALIDPKDWDKGVEHVNGLIEVLQK